MRFAVQLYSLRDMVTDGESFLALFPKLKAMGFDGVEFAGYHGLSAEEIRKALNEAGLVAVGAHVDISDIAEEKLQATLDFHKALGLKRLGLWGAPHGDKKELAETCAVLSQASKIAQQQGITLYYHNHASEFEAFDDGTLPMDALKLACMLEVDTYWTHVAGVDSYEFITQNKARVCHVHIKDGIAGEACALGEGNCDLYAVVRAANEIGLEWLILEDETRHQGFKSVQLGIAWLNKNT